MFDLSGWLDNWDWLGVISDEAPTALRVVFGVLGAVGAAVMLRQYNAAGVDSWGWLVGCALVGGLGNITLLGEKGNLTVVMGNTAALAGVLCVAASALGPADERAARVLWAACTPWVAAPLIGRMWTATFWSLSMVRTAHDKSATIERALAGDESSMLVRLGECGPTGFEATRCLQAGDEPLVIDAEVLSSENDTWKAPGVYFLLDQPQCEMLREAGAHYRDQRQVRRIHQARSADFVGTSRGGITPDLFRAEARAGVAVLVLTHGLVAAVALWAPRWMG